MAGECILVVDDSKEIVKHLTQHVLPSYNYKTLYAYDGKSGLKLIQEEKPDLVMLDYNLPEMTGLDVLQEMAKLSITIPVVLMTGYGSELSAIEAFRLGAKDYLIKPFTVDEIVDTIDRALMETRLIHDKEELAEQLRRVKVEMSRQSHEMNTLFNIGKAITSLLSVDKVLARVLDAATYLTRAEESIIWLLNEAGTHLYAYEQQEVDKEATRSVSLLSLKGTQLGEVIETGRPLRHSTFTGQGIKLETGLFARSVLYVPLNLRGVPVGVLGVSNLIALRTFSKRDEFLLSFLADYAAIALENARVFQAADQALAARLEELNTLIEITRTITSSLDLQEIIRMTIKQVHDSWHIEASSIWLVDKNQQSLYVLTNVGTPDEILTKMRVPMGEGFVGTVAQSGKVIYTNDVATHPLHYREIDTKTGFLTRSLLCVPLVFRGEVVGAMQLLNKQDGPFDAQDVERALSIAAAVAVAVTNAKMFKDADLQKQHLEATLEHTLNPIVITDAKNRILLLNKEARSRFGLSEEVIGRPVTAVFRDPKIISLYEHDQENSQPPVELTLPDKSVWLPRLAPIPGHGRILILQEITFLKKLDIAKDNFVATVSHDMRAPLNTITGFAQHLADAGPLNAQQQTALKQIHHAANQMSNLVDGLLALAKVKAQLTSPAVPCQMDEIVAEVIYNLEAFAASKKIKIIYHTDKKPNHVMGNPEQLYNAVSNLIDNAIKFSPAGKDVSVKIHHVKGGTAIEVHDQGVGIAPDDIPHIFEKFYRGKTAVNINGTGLGLALVKTIVDAHNGRIQVTSDNKKGTTFIIWLPGSS
ncbi:MAG: hypothetical protein Kow0080_32770 [Candidatus Promineifilaceae bacterium]